MPKHTLLFLPLSLIVSSLSVYGQLVINKGDPTTGLANTLWINEAATGGEDTDTNEESTQSFTEELPYGVGIPGTITITGWGFAANANADQQDAVSLDITFTYEGALPGFQDGDEVIIGTVSNIAYNHAGAGIYYVNFGANSVSAPIDGANDGFRISVTVNDTNAQVVESIRFKRTAELDVKFSIAGTYESGGGDPTWASYPIREDGFVDTGPFFGWIWIGDPIAPSDWVWSVSLNTYVYLPVDQVDPQSGAWAYSQ